jgi:hypothetical protein
MMENGPIAEPELLEAKAHLRLLLEKESFNQAFSAYREGKRTKAYTDRIEQICGLVDLANTYF